MKINYHFVPEHESAEEKFKQDLVSYAGRLLEISGCCTLIVGIDNDDKPFVWQCNARLNDALDVCFQP